MEKGNRTSLTSRLLALVMAAALLLSLLPATALTVRAEGDHTVTVTLSDPSLATVKLDGVETNSATIPEDDFVALEIQCTDGAGIVSVSVNGTPQTVDYLTSFYNDTFTVSEDLDIQVEVTKKHLISVSKSPSDGGVVKLNGTVVEHSDFIQVPDGAALNLEVTPGTKYAIERIIAEDHFTDFNAETHADGYTGDTVVTSNFSIAVEFKKIWPEHTLTVTKTGNGAVKLNGAEVDAVTVDEGDDVAISLTPDTGWEIGSVRIDGTEETLTDAQKAQFDKTVTVNADVAVEVTFVKKSYTVSVGSYSNGTVTAKKNGTAAEPPFTAQTGDQVSFAVTPAAGYVLDEVLLNGKSPDEYGAVTSAEGNASVFTVNNLAEALTLQVSFVLKGEVTWSSVTFSPGYFGPYDSSSPSRRIYVYPNSVTELPLGLNIPHVTPKLYLNGSETATTKLTESAAITELSYSYTKWMKEYTGAVTLPADEVDFVLDQTAPEFVPGNYYEDACINGNLTIPFQVCDPDWLTEEGKEQKEYDNLSSSGVSTVKAEIRASATHDFSSVTPEYKDLVTVDADTRQKLVHATLDLFISDYNNQYVQVTLTATDRAGNSSTKTFELSFSDKTCEITSFTYDASAPYNAPYGESNMHYFYNGRTATIVIETEEPMVFNDEAGLELIGTVTDIHGNPITDDDGNPIDPPFTVDGWSLEVVDGKTRFYSTLSFADGRYDLTGIKYTSKNGESMTFELSGQANRQFVVDREAPGAQLQAPQFDDTTWAELLTALTFGRWSNTMVKIYLYASDTISEIDRMDYYISESDAPLSQSELEALADSDWTSFKGEGGYFQVPANKLFVAYVRVADAAGNVTYRGTDGIITDNQYPEITMTAEPGYQGKQIYGIADDAKVDVTVKEPANGSGLKKIEWWLEYWDGEKYVKTAGETVLDQSYDHFPTNSELIREKSFTVNVDKAANNYSDVKLYVNAVDNAGNAPETPENLTLDIDVTAPVIEIEYQREQGEGADPGCYRSVIADVKITERTNHFDPAEATAGIVITATDANGDPITDGWLYNIDGWYTTEGDTPDEAVHVARVAFLEDGNYTITVNYTDKAGNPTAQVTDNFTLDSTPPTGTVTVEGKCSWSSLKEFLTFGLWSSSAVQISATAVDTVSDVVYADYYKTDSADILTEAQLKALPAAEWKSFNLSGKLSVDPEERFTVYLRLRDKAGNIRYLNTDGVIVDSKQAEITLTPSAPAKNGIYNIDSDVKVAVDVQEPDPGSGIKSVEYWIMCAGTETARETVFEFDYTRDPGDDANGGDLQIYENGSKIYDDKGVYPGLDQLRTGWSGEIEVDKYANNSCDVEVFVKVTDNAGNENTKSVKLDIDATAPEAYIYYDNNSPYKTVDERGYYPADRTATIVIFERDHHFSAEDAKNGIVITAKDAKGKTVLSDAEIKAMIGAWTYSPGEGPDGDRHIAEIKYSADANYTFSISYTDKAGNTGFTTAMGQTTPWKFTVDKTAPTATVEAKGINSWDKLIETLTFGIFTKAKVDYTGTWDDVTSPIESVSYYKTNSNKALKVADLKAVSDWKSFNGLSVSPNERVTLYLRVVDYAGNTYYVSTDGIIIDDTAPVVESVTPRVTVSPAQPVNGIYNTDVPIKVVVEDPIVNGSYAGLKEIRYEVKNLGAVTQSGTLYTYSGTAHSQSDLKQIWQSDSAITVDRTKNNSNEVEILVYAVDNAGNEGKGSAEIKIDITPPTISVSYDNNNGDNTFADAASGAYFNAPRTATIVITERNFDPAAVQLTLSNAYGVAPTLSAWRTEGGGGNGDGTRHIATLSFADDGVYNFDIACSDLAGNRNDGVTWEGLSPQRFTIDRTAPVIRVDYEPAVSANGSSYFDGPRTATITINERNFETSRIEITLRATDHGEAITLPAVEGWTDSGDSHTATIAYTADGVYSFDIAYRDKAGNAAEDYPGDEFCVDQTPPAVELKGVADESANGGKGKLGFTLSATDTNLDIAEFVITGSFYRDGEFVTEVVQLGEIKDIPDGKQLVVDNLPEDGIYTVRCKAVDKAGNAYEEVTLYDKDGKAYTAAKTAADDLVSFSVNRKGSAYSIDDATAQLVEHYYVQRVNNDVVLVEINTDEVKEHTVTLNGKELTEGVDYTVTVEGGKGEWHKYTYRVNAALFEAEGSYSVVVSSTDMADNATFSDVKGVGVKFVVDRTAPVVTVSGMETDGRYQTERQLVTLVPTDDGGALRSLVVNLVDEDGNVVQELVNLEGEAFDKALEENDGKITFTLDEGLYQNVRVICDDWAYYGDEENVIYDETFTDVSVSSSALKIFWANKPLRWGSIGGVGGLGAAGVLFALLKKRKKKEADVKEVKKDAKK